MKRPTLMEGKDMAAPRGEQLIDGVAEPQHYVQRSERELRRQSVHRLQIGLFGLAAMLLIVGLANIIMDQAQTVDARDPIEQVIAADEPQEEAVIDPLADAGVVPAADPTPGPGGASPAKK